MGYLKMREIVSNLSVLKGRCCKKHDLFTLMSFQYDQKRIKENTTTDFNCLHTIFVFFCVLQMKELHAFSFNCG